MSERLEQLNERLKQLNERLGQVKEELNQVIEQLNRLGRNEAIVKEEEVIFDKVLEALGRGSCINAKQPPSEVVAQWERNGRKEPRALPKKQQYLERKRIREGYQRLLNCNPLAKAFYERLLSESAHLCLLSNLGNEVA